LGLRLRAGLTPGTYLITPFATGIVFTPSSRLIDLSDDVAGVGFSAAQPNRALAGRITLDGRGLPGVQVTAGGSLVTSDGSGAYGFPSLPARSYTVTPVLPGYAFTPAERVVLLRSDQRSIDFTAVVVPTPVSLQGPATIR
jgi:hypothetical protein